MGIQPQVLSPAGQTVSHSARKGRAFCVRPLDSVAHFTVTVTLRVRWKEPEAAVTLTL